MALESICGMLNIVAIWHICTLQKLLELYKYEISFV
jgi:hypothetical protein